MCTRLKLNHGGYVISTIYVFFCHERRATHNNVMSDIKPISSYYKITFPQPVRLCIDYVRN